MKRKWKKKARWIFTFKACTLRPRRLWQKRSCHAWRHPGHLDKRQWGKEAVWYGENLGDDMGKDHCKNGVRGKNGKLCFRLRCMICGLMTNDYPQPAKLSVKSLYWAMILNLISVSVRTWRPVLKIKVTVVKKHQTFKGLSFYLPIQTSDWNEMPDVANISFEDKILLDDIDQRRSRSRVLVSRGGQTRNIFTRHMAAAATSGNTAVTPPTVPPPSLEQFL